jgi:hypothetical protein
MSIEELVQLLLGNMSLLLLVVAVGIVIAQYRRQHNVEAGVAEPLFRWVALLAVGVTGLYTAVMHVFLPERTASHIGWQTSPFQYEVGMADLATGVLGVLAFRASFGFRLATTVATACWLWGDAVGHVRQMIVAHNFAPGNAGSWFWTDVLVPLILVACIVPMWRREQRQQAATDQRPRRTGQVAF